MSRGCPSTSQRERWQASLDRIEALLEVLYTSYEEAITGSQKSYSLNTAGGSQRVERRSLAELKKEIESLEAEADQLWRRLNCQGVTTLRLRRLGGGYGYR